MRTMRILSIETSCDETAISLLEANETMDGVSFNVLANITHSQALLHSPYGGVFPALAKREHLKNLPVILEEILKPLPNPPLQGEGAAPCDYICVTSGPGLEPALWCGIVCAKELGEKWNVPVVPVNHMEGHILSVLVPQTNPSVSLEAVASHLPLSRGGSAPFEFKNSNIEFPALALLISGGHTELVLAKKIGDYEIIGKTRDDAVGEAFDKIARILGLLYPGGPEVSKLASLARSEAPSFRGGGEALRAGGVSFPRPMMHTKDFDFSFSGLKTAVLYYSQSLPAPLSQKDKMAIALEFENAVADVLVHKTKKALEEFGVQTLIIGGGVSANTFIKSEMKKMINQEFPDVQLLVPEKELTGDNALMIALAGYFKIKKDPSRVYSDIKAEGNLSL